MDVNRLMPQLTLGRTMLPSIFLFLFIQGSSPLLIQDCAEAESEIRFLTGSGCVKIEVPEGSPAPIDAVQLQPQVLAAPKGAICMSRGSSVCMYPGQSRCSLVADAVCVNVWIKGIKSTGGSKTEARLDSCQCQCVSRRLLPT
jgi:hypothetical protein